jgi:hypothetical protein
MKKEILKAVRDAQDIDLPKDVDSIEKIKGVIENGTRLHWYYKEDLEYFREYVPAIENPRECSEYSGIAISIPGQESGRGDLEEGIIVVIDNYPVEKCYPEITWVALNRLIDDPELVEIYSEEV